MGTNLKVFAIVILTLLVYTGLANMIPQVQSEVPQELTFGSDVTPEQLVAAGDQLFHGAGGCTACHGLGTRAPNLLTDEGGTGAIGARCGTREPGKDCKQYLHESLVQPGVFVVAGYQPIMPDMSRTLSPAQVWSLVAYLESVGGEVSVTPYDVQTAVAEAGAAAPQGAQTSVPATPAGGSSATLDPMAILQGNACLACHAIGGEGGAIGPSFDGIGARLSTDRIRLAILMPNADTTKGYEAVAGTMPPTFGTQLNAAQLEALVTFLAAHK
jgi:mono/diheme cytochrome c family protein